jgi:divalent metal cation (Fe/Co/Zn/Cd) transporter
MSADSRVTPEQLAEERSLLFALVADVGMLISFLLVGLLGGSLTLTAEFIRGSLMNMIEVFALVVMRRIHRGVLADLEFGTGKLEQIANLVIGVGMLGGAAWIVVKALAIVVGERTVGAPFGLALAAVAGALNAYVNLLAWDAMRRAARLGGSSLVMHGQLQARVVKLVSSLAVTVTMTIAALSTDNVVVAWADAGGSIFVAVFIFANAIVMLQSGVPDLLDRSAGKAVRATVERTLARHADEYRQLDRLRSRRSGRVVFIEIALSFEAGLTIAEVNRRIEILRHAMSREIEHADISILALANPERV